MCAGCQSGNQDLSREEGIPLEGKSGLVGEESMLHLGVRAPQGKKRTFTKGCHSQSTMRSVST